MSEQTLYWMLDTMVRRLRDKVNQSTGHMSLSPDYYQFIPMHSRDAIKRLSIVMEKLTTKQPLFLDVGCGIGNIMLYAESLGMEPNGIEYDYRILNQALYPSIYTERIYMVGYGKYTYPKTHTIYHCDAFKFKGYREYDVIYMYCPVGNVRREQKLEEKIENEMKEEAYYICMGKQSRKIMRDDRFERIDDCVWQKIGE